jgi:hypothetical protein
MNPMTSTPIIWLSVPGGKRNPYGILSALS